MHNDTATFFIGLMIVGIGCFAVLGLFMMFVKSGTRHRRSTHRHGSGSDSSLISWHSDGSWTPVSPETVNPSIETLPPCAPHHAPPSTHHSTSHFEHHAPHHSAPQHHDSGYHASSHDAAAQGSHDSGSSHHGSFDSGHFDSGGSFDAGSFDSGSSGSY